MIYCAKFYVIRTGSSINARRLISYYKRSRRRYQFTANEVMKHSFRITIHLNSESNRALDALKHDGYYTIISFNIKKSTFFPQYNYVS
jgi:hypothetical protein